MSKKFPPSIAFTVDTASTGVPISGHVDSDWISVTAKDLSK